MKLFLDTSTLLSACGSPKGASREIFRLASSQGWILITTPYVVEEVSRNLVKLPPEAGIQWDFMRGKLVMLEDIVTIDRAALFQVSKDRPVLFSALAWADILLTLDQGDFGEMLGGSFYELSIFKPGDFLFRERLAGRLGPKKSE